MFSLQVPIRLSLNYYKILCKYIITYDTIYFKNVYFMVFANFFYLLILLSYHLSAIIIEILPSTIENPTVILKLSKVSNEINLLP